MIPGANPIANSINPAAPINGTAQGMPAPKAFGAYTNSPTSNVMGTWGAAQYSGIPGDGANSPQGAPSGGGNYGGRRGGGSSSGSGHGIYSAGYINRGHQISAPSSSSNGTWTATQGAGFQFGPRVSAKMVRDQNAGNAAGVMALGQKFGYGSGTSKKGASSSGDVLGGSWGGGITGVPAAGSGGGYTPSGGWSGSGSGTYHVGSYAGGSFSLKDGGPVPGVKHTSKKVKGYDDGGSVTDNSNSDNSDSQDSIPNPGGAIPADPTDPGDVSSFNQGSGSGQNENSALMQAVYQTLTYGRQKNGLSNQLVNMAYNSIPTKPAGPGGDQTRGGPQDRSNPKIAGNIPTKPAGPGGDQTRGGPQDRGNQQVSENDSDQDEGVAAAVGGAIPDALGGGVPQGARGGMGGGFGGVGGGMRRGGGSGDITGARGMGGGMGSIRPDLSPRGSGGFLAMKKGGAIPEEDEH